MANFLQDATFRKTLTNYTVGNYAEIGALTGPFLAPFTQVPVPYGFVQSYDSLAAFQATEDATRQPGQSALQVSWGGKPTSYNIVPRAMDTPIDQALMDMSDADTAMIHYESMAKGLVSRAHLNLEYQIWSYASASVSRTTTAGGVSNIGAGWSTASVSTSPTNPMTELEAIYFQIAGDIGIAPNRIVMGSSAFRYLKTAASTRGTWPVYVTDTNALTQYFKNGLGIGTGLQSMVAYSAYGSNPGQSTRTMSSFVGTNEVWMFYASEAPDRNDRSAFKTLQFGRGIDNLRSYMTPDQRTTMLALDWYATPFFANQYAVKKILVT